MNQETLPPKKNVQDLNDPVHKICQCIIVITFQN